MSEYYLQNRIRVYGRRVFPYCCTVSVINLLEKYFVTVSLFLITSTQQPAQFTGQMLQHAITDFHIKIN